MRNGNQNQCAWTQLEEITNRLENLEQCNTGVDEQLKELNVKVDKHKAAQAEVNERVDIQLDSVEERLAGKRTIINLVIYDVTEKRGIYNGN